MLVFVNSFTNKILIRQLFIVVVGGEMEEWNNETCVILSLP